MDCLSAAAESHLGSWSMKNNLISENDIYENEFYNLVSISQQDKRKCDFKAIFFSNNEK